MKILPKYLFISALFTVFFIACEDNTTNKDSLPDSESASDTYNFTDTDTFTGTDTNITDTTDSETDITTDSLDTEVDTSSDTGTENNTDTGTENSDNGVMTGPVERSGSYVLEFNDSEHTWKFSCKPEDGGRITEFSIDGDDILVPQNSGPQEYGSIFWTSPQTTWNWPPPAGINSDTWSASADESNYTITLTSGTINIGGNSVQIEKKFSVDLTTKSVKLEYTINNLNPNNAVSFAPWEISRVKADGITYYPMGDGNITSGSFGAVDHENINEIIWADNTLNGAGDFKLFSDGMDGWLAHTDGNVVFIKSFEDIPQASAAPNEAEIELYTKIDNNNTANSYEEVEVQGEYKSIPKSGSYTWPVTWQLLPFPNNGTFEAGNPSLLEYTKNNI